MLIWCEVGCRVHFGTSPFKQARYGWVNNRQVSRNDCDTGFYDLFGALQMTLLTKTSKQLTLLAAFGLLAVGSTIAPAHAGLMQVPHVAPLAALAEDANPSFQTVGWANRIAKRTTRNAKRAAAAAQKRAYDKKRKETDYGSIKGKIVLTPKKKTNP